VPQWKDQHRAELFPKEFRRDVIAVPARPISSGRIAAGRHCTAGAASSRCRWLAGDQGNPDWRPRRAGAIPVEPASAHADFSPLKWWRGRRSSATSATYSHQAGHPKATRLSLQPQCLHTRVRAEAGAGSISARQALEPTLPVHHSKTLLTRLIHLTEKVTRRRRTRIHPPSGQPPDVSAETSPA
jgi:hypothetical protein